MTTRYCSQQLLHRPVTRILWSGSSYAFPVWKTRLQKAILCKTSKNSGDIDPVVRLQAENAALRRELAKYQGVPPQQVTFEFEDVWQWEGYGVGEDTDEAEAMGPELAGRLDVSNLEDGVVWPLPDEQPPFWERAPRTAPLPRYLLGDRTPPEPPDPRPLYVVHMTAEMAPLAKVGGLGDVVTGLARACLAKGHVVEVVLPFYECLPEDQVQDLQHELDFDCPKGVQWDGRLQVRSLRTSAWRGRIESVPVILLRPDWSACNIFRGSRIYGGAYNELEAYLYFSRACLEFLRVSGRNPDVLHVHEWQLSAVPMIYWDKYHMEGLNRPRCILTIHNLDNVGDCRQDEFGFTGLDGSSFATVERALDERTIGHNPERLCLMKGGIVYSNWVTTVSPTYAREALDGGAAGWLRSTLAKPDVRAKFQGVLNGIDTAFWDPATDPFLPAPFNVELPQGKIICKRYLQQGLGLDVDPDAPVIACITRLVPQKGIHLIRHAVFRAAELGCQFVLLGTGHADGDFKKMRDSDFAGSKAVRLLLMYSEALAHLINAAADMVLVPSMYEPCGLTQLIAMRYGAVPVVRATGGLADTVHDVDAEGEVGNGFTFTGVDETSLNSALDRAIALYRDHRVTWEELALKNMRVDSSWQTSASQYLDIYKHVITL